MSVIKPEIDSLLQKTGQNPFCFAHLLLSVLAILTICFSRSAPMCNRCSDFDDIITVASGKDSVSVAMKEINDGTLGFVSISFDEAIKARTIHRLLRVMTERVCLVQLPR